MKKILLLFLTLIAVATQADALTLEVHGNTVDNPVTVTTDKPAFIIFRMNNGTPIYAYGTSAKFIPHLTGKLLISAIAGDEKAVKVVEIQQQPSSGGSGGGGSSNIYWEGTVGLPSGTFTKTATNGKVYTIGWRTAMGALEMASRNGGFSYTIKETQWGPFVSCIAGKCEGSEGATSGWMYWVNYPNDPLPGVSADKFSVKDGDVVYWYFSTSMSDTPDTSSMILKIYVKYQSTGSRVTTAGGGGGSSTTEGKFVISRSLTALTPTTIDVHTADLVEIKLNPKETGYYRIEVEEIEKPEKPPNAIATYKFFKLEVDKPIVNATVKFRVSKNWTKEHGYKPNQISLLKYNGYWIQLPTKFVGNDSRYYYFESNVSSFSVFAIAVTRWDNFPLNVTDEPILKALGYLKSIQHEDGGFGEEESNFAKTCWVVMALVSAKQDPHKWIKNGSSPIDYLRANINNTEMGTADYARTILALLSAGEDPRNFGGVDLVSKLKERVKQDGQIGDFIYTTIWGIIALSACGENVSKSVEWLIAHQNEDGGFGWAVGAESDYDDTASAIQALIAGGVPRDSEVIKKALGYLKTGQNDDGGFRYFGNSASNSASDAWIIQGLVAAGENPMEWRKNNVSVVEHLLSLQTSEGYFKYTKYEVSNPCYMTSCAVMALLGKCHPIRLEGFVDINVSLNATTATPTPTFPIPTPVVEETPIPTPVQTTPTPTQKPKTPGFTAICLVLALAVAVGRFRR